ncbi:MAG: phenylalanine--tRNA ligase subunit beta, partial [SAR86 cluster bacterium]|nr:phenylalanine--tRNA ligase subunit beta [SAR86 cluster bacterium]
SWRYDINIEADLIEELARLEGYDSLPQTSLTPVYKKRNKTSEEVLSESLISKGFNEIISYSFISPEDHDLFGVQDITLQVKNPISQNMSIMRTNLVSGLLNSCIYNLNHGQNDQRLFEIGNTFIQKNKTVQETKTLAGIIKGNVSDDYWNEKSRESSFYDLKGIVLDLLANFEVQYSFKPATNKFLHPGMSSSIVFNNKSVGFLGSLHPEYLEKLGLKQDIFIFSLEIPNLIHKPITSYREFSRQPLTSRDLAFLINKEITAETLQQVIESSAGKFFKDIKIFDVYQGKGITDDKKSIALSVSWQSMKNTLLDSDIDTAVEKIVNSVKSKLGGELRI